MRAARQHAPDFLAEARPDAPDTDKLAEVRRLCLDLAYTDSEVSELEGKLAEAKARQRELEHRTIPDAMDAAGTDNLGLPELGVDVRIKPWYDGTLPKRDDPQRRQAAIDWLVQHEHGDLIKTTISILFGRSEHNLAVATFEAIREYLAQQGLPNIVGMLEDVHPMTLKAFLREQHEHGEVLPLDTLNATIGRVAKIEKRRER